MQQNEQLITQWAPALLNMQLDDLLWQDRNEINVGELWKLLCTYCYLPRLASYDVLATAIQNGVNSEDYFAYADGINDGKYHNKKFKETAEAHGLHIDHHATYGWTITTLAEETAEWLAQQPGMENITASRKTTLQIKTKADDDEGGETTTTIKGGRSTSKNRSIKYVCPQCGAIIRATRQVNVVCGDCDVPFEQA